MEGPPMLALFAGELRRARTAAGLSQEGLAEAIQYSASLVAMVESCRRFPGPDFTPRCDKALETGGLLGRIREAMLKEGHTPWFREWPTIEEEASAIRDYEPLLIPGLLQTEEYARNLIIGSILLNYDAEQLVATRMARQAVLTKENPLQLFAIIDESALRRVIGGPKVMYEQMMRLLELNELPNVHLHVVPAEAGSYGGLDGSFVIGTLPDGRDVGYLDHPLGGLLIERAEDIKVLRHAWECVRAEALTRKQTIELIRKVAESWS